jgi:hypothetical protein
MFISRLRPGDNEFLDSVLDDIDNALCIVDIIIRLIGILVPFTDRLQWGKSLLWILCTCNGGPTR